MSSVTFDKKLVLASANQNINTALNKVGKILVDSIRGSMISGKGRRYKYGYGGGRRGHIAALPGDPPAPYTGRLRDSIMYVVNNSGDKSSMGPNALRSDELHVSSRISRTTHTVTVGTSVPYALYLELGVNTGSNLRAYPFLGVALKREKAAIKEAFKII